MAKKNRPDKRASQAGGGGFQNNPFASLANLAGVEPGPPAAPVVPPEEEASAPRFSPKVVVRREKKGRGGKTATRITGVAEPEAFATEMKRALGCGATVEGTDIVLLGDVADRAARWLEQAGAKKVVRGS